MRISDWSSDVCSSDLAEGDVGGIEPVVSDGRFRVEAGRTPVHERRRADRRLARKTPVEERAGIAAKVEIKPGRHFHQEVVRVLPIDERFAIRRLRSEEHTSELQSLMRISYAVFRLKKNT